MLATKSGKERKAIAILRVSSDEQARKGASLESQEEWMSTVANQMNLKIVKILKDVVSGETFPRKYFNEIIDTVQKENIQYILVYALDRLARNLPYGAYLLEKLHEIGKVRIITSTGIFELSNRNHRAQVWFALLMGEMEQGSREERTMRGMITKLKHGEWPLTPPFGYEIVDGKLRLKGEYKSVIISIFDTFIKAKSYAQTARIVNEKYGRSMKFKLTANKIKKIIEDKTYLGYLRWNGMIFGEGEEKKPREELKVIDNETFEKAQAVAAQISKRYSKKDFAIMEKLIEEYGIENATEILNLKPSCPRCGSSTVQRNGKEENRLKFICKNCNYQFRIPSKKQMKKLMENIYLACPKCGCPDIYIKLDNDFLELKCKKCGDGGVYLKYQYKNMKPIKEHIFNNNKKKKNDFQQKLNYFLSIKNWENRD